MTNMGNLEGKNRRNKQRRWKGRSYMIKTNIRKSGLFKDLLTKVNVKYNEVEEETDENNSIYEPELDEITKIIETFVTAIQSKQVITT